MQNRIYFKEISKDEERKILKIIGSPSTPDVDREGDIIETTAFAESIKTYMRASGSIFYNHDWDKVVGKITDYIEPTETTPLIITAEIYPVDEYVYKIVELGLVKSFSVAFLPKNTIVERDERGLIKASKITDAELLDISIVTVPANPYANFSILKSLLKNENEEKIIKYIKANIDLDNITENDKKVLENLFSEKTEDDFISVKKSELDRLLKSVGELTDFSLRLIKELEGFSNEKISKYLSELKHFKE